MNAPSYLVFDIFYEHVFCCVLIKISSCTQFVKHPKRKILNGIFHTKTCFVVVRGPGILDLGSTAEIFVALFMP